MPNPSRSDLSAALTPLAGYSKEQLDEKLHNAYQTAKDGGELIEHQGVVPPFEVWRRSLMVIATKTLCKEGTPIPSVNTVVDIAEALAHAAIPRDMVGHAEVEIACLLAAQIVKIGLGQFCIGSNEA